MARPPGLSAARDAIIDLSPCEPEHPHDDVAVPDALARHGFRPLQEDWTTWNAPRVVLTLSLEGDEDALHRRLRKGTRRDLAAAQRRGAQVRVAGDRADLLAFHQLTVAAGREKGYPVRPFERLEALWDAYVVRGDGVLLLTEHEGAVIGGVLGLRFGRRAYLQRAAISRSVEGQRVHQGPLLYWEFIRWAKAAGCELIDWGGSGTRFPPSETDQGHGVYQFKPGSARSSSIECHTTTSSSGPRSTSWPGPERRPPWRGGSSRLNR